MCNIYINTFAFGSMHCYTIHFCKHPPKVSPILTSNHLPVTTVFTCIFNALSQATQRTTVTHTIKKYTSQCCIISGPYSQSYQSIGDLVTSCMMFAYMMICKSESIIIISMSLHNINRILV
jgi:hypothetical protein